MIAVGTYKGYTQIWDVAANKKVNNLHGHTARVGQLSSFYFISKVVLLAGSAKIFLGGCW